MRHSPLVIRISAALAAAVSLALTAPARAQIFADKVPPDAIAYADWAGSDSLGPAYNGSHLKAFLESLNLPNTITQLFNEYRVRPTSPREQQQLNAATDILAALATSPTAVYVGPLDFSTNPAQPVPSFAYFSKVGKEKAGSLADSLTKLIAANRGPGSPEATAVAAGEFVLVYTGNANIDGRLSGAIKPPRSLSDVEAFKNAFARLAPPAPNAPRAATVYFDAQATAEMLSAGIQAGPDARTRRQYPILAEGLGINSLTQFAWAGNFDGADWHASTFLGMRDKRNGVLAFFDNPPLAPESLKLIPKSATAAGALRFDGMRLLADTLATAAKIDANTPKQIETALKDVYIWTGVDVNHDLFPGLGTEFMYYGTPEAAGNSLRGFTVVNRLRDAKKAQNAFQAAEDYLNAYITQRDPKSKIQFQTKALAAPWDKVTAHVLPLSNATPAWAIHNDTLFFSLSLPALQSALDMTTGKQPTILENPEFLALRKKLGHDSFSAFNFADLPKSAPETYEVFNKVISDVLAKSPTPQAFAMPPLNKITPALSPSLRIAWTDAEGYHAEESSPFPFASLLSSVNFIPLLFADQIQQTRARPQPRTTPLTLPDNPNGLP